MHWRLCIGAVVCDARALMSSLSELARARPVIRTFVIWTTLTLLLWVTGTRPGMVVLTALLGLVLVSLRAWGVRARRARAEATPDQPPARD